VVAELMIAANSAVAQRIHLAFPRAAILRRHPAPPAESFAELHALLQSVYAALPADRVPALGHAATATNGALAATLRTADSLLPPQVVSLLKVSAVNAA
jgi:exoribonuclease R